MVHDAMVGLIRYNNNNYRSLQRLYILPKPIVVFGLEGGEGFYSCRNIILHIQVDLSADCLQIVLIVASLRVLFSGALVAHISRARGRGDDIIILKKFSGWK